MLSTLSFRMGTFIKLFHFFHNIVDGYIISLPSLWSHIFSEFSQQEMFPCGMFHMSDLTCQFRNNRGILLMDNKVDKILGERYIFFYWKEKLKGILLYSFVTLIIEIFFREHFHLNQYLYGSFSIRTNDHVNWQLRIQYSF